MNRLVAIREMFDAVNAYHFTGERPAAEVLGTVVARHMVRASLALSTHDAQDLQARHLLKHAVLLSGVTA